MNETKKELNAIKQFMPAEKIFGGHDVFFEILILAFTHQMDFHNKVLKEVNFIRKNFYKKTGSYFFFQGRFSARSA